MLHNRNHEPDHCSGEGRVLKYLKWRGVDILVTIVFLIIGFTAVYYVKSPPIRFFVERDPLLSFPYTPDHSQEVPTTILGVLAAIVTLGILYVSHATCCCYRCKSRTKHPHVFVLYYFDLPVLALGQAIGMELLFVNVLKYFQSRYRPHFFAACNYKGYADGLAANNITAYLAATTPGAIGNVANCWYPASQWTDAVLSNPSGHAGTIFAGWTVLALALLYHLRAKRDSWPSWIGRAWILPFILFPFIGAELVTATRTRDYAHNFDDVIHGSIIGLACGALAFFVNYGLRPAMRVADPNRTASEQTRMEAYQGAKSPTFSESSSVVERDVENDTVDTS